MPGSPNSLTGAPPQLLCDLAILWMHMLLVLRSTCAAPASLLKNQLEGLRAHGGTYLVSAYQNHLRIIANLMPKDVVLMVSALFSHGCEALRALDMVNSYFSTLFSSWSECEAALRTATLNLRGIVDVRWLVEEGAPIAGTTHRQLNPLNEGVFKYMQNNRILAQTASRLATLHLWQHQLRTTQSSWHGTEENGVEIA